MRKFCIVLLIILLLFLIGCVNLDNYVPIEDYNKLQKTFDGLIVERKNLIEENNSLENKNIKTEEKLGKYEDLISNINSLLDNVYYIYGENGKYYAIGTGFSIEYNGKYYLLTAGHIIESKFGYFSKLGFKNEDKDWIYPKLLDYKVTDDIPDYAIFYSDKISSGLKIDYDNDYSRFILGTKSNNLNIIRGKTGVGREGESGSPIIDYEGEVTGIYIGSLQDIEEVLEAIDRLE